MGRMMGLGRPGREAAVAAAAEMEEGQQEQGLLGLGLGVAAEGTGRRADLAQSGFNTRLRRAKLFLGRWEIGTPSGPHSLFGRG